MTTFTDKLTFLLLLERDYAEHFAEPLPGVMTRKFGHWLCWQFGNVWLLVGEKNDNGQFPVWVFDNDCLAYMAEMDKVQEIDYPQRNKGPVSIETVQETLDYFAARAGA